MLDCGTTRLDEHGSTEYWADERVRNTGAGRYSDDSKREQVGGIFDKGVGILVGRANHQITKSPNGCGG